MTKRKRTKQRSTKHTQKTKGRATQTPLKPWVNSRAENILQPSNLPPITK
jgi:hypothetical protein